MSDRDVIQKAYEEALAQIYGEFAAAFAAAAGARKTEVELEARFLRTVVCARQARDRALALLGTRPAAKVDGPSECRAEYPANPSPALLSALTFGIHAGDASSLGPSQGHLPSPAGSVGAVLPFRRGISLARDQHEA